MGIAMPVDLKLIVEQYQHIELIENNEDDWRAARDHWQFQVRCRSQAQKSPNFRLRDENQWNSYQPDCQQTDKTPQSFASRIDKCAHQAQQHRGRDLCDRRNGNQSPRDKHDQQGRKKPDENEVSRPLYSPWQPKQRCLDHDEGQRHGQEEDDNQGQDLDSVEPSNNEELTVPSQKVEKRLCNRQTGECNQVQTLLEKALAAFFDARSPRM